MTITVVFDPPQPSDSPATFNTKAFSTLGDLNDWSTQANALAVEVNADEAVLAAAVASASGSASTATGAASTATTQAGTATTAASTATAQAGIATAKAGEANASAIAAAGSAATAAATLTSKLNAANPTYTGTLTGGTGVVNLGGGQLVKDAAGNLGLGVTPSAWNGDYKVAQIGANGAIAGRVGSSNTLDVATNCFRNAAGDWKYISSQPAVRMNVDGSTGAFLWYTAPSGTAGNQISWTAAMTLDTAGNLVLTSGTLGYGAGAGGTVTQVTNKNTSVTLNKPSGLVTTHDGAMTAGQTNGFVLFNSFCTSSNDQIVVSIYQTVSATNYNIWSANNGSGQFVINIKNVSGGSLSEAIPIAFSIIKGATA